MIILAARMFSLKRDEYSSDFCWRKDTFSAAFPKLHGSSKNFPLLNEKYFTFSHIFIIFKYFNFSELLMRPSPKCTSSIVILR